MTTPVHRSIMLFFLFVGCDRSVTKLQYMPDMADTPTVKAQRDYLDPPEHALAVDAMIYPETVEESEAVLTNEVAVNNEVLSEGKELYETYCQVCHGADAKGGPNMLGPQAPLPPDITHPAYASRADGFYFHRITFGKLPLMPGYGHATDRVERWKIVHYVRTLQKKGS